MLDSKVRNRMGAWIRHVDKKSMREKVKVWYDAQSDKSSPVVKKVVDLTHWDVVHDWYTIDNLMAIYKDPPVDEVAKALEQCGYPADYAAARAAVPITETQGLRYMGGHHCLKHINPLGKYLDRAYRVHGPHR
jgi:hypothetical protein